MLLGAFFAGLAIENSMLGASHACANPLTSNHGITHGVAIAVLLPQVVRWNAPVVGNRYGELMRLARGNGSGSDSPQALALRLEGMVACGKMPTNLRAVGVSKQDLARLAEAAMQQWTGRFNPRPLDKAGALEVYEWAF
jgi:alcohol dehydrogenase